MSRGAKCLRREMSRYEKHRTEIFETFLFLLVLIKRYVGVEGKERIGNFPILSLPKEKLKRSNAIIFREKWLNAILSVMFRMCWYQFSPNMHQSFPFPFPPPPKEIFPKEFFGHTISSFHGRGKTRFFGIIIFVG